MRAVVMRNKALAVAAVPEPAPGAGEVLVRTLACGICGSDLHALKHADRFVEAWRRAGNAFVMDLGRDVVMGHEFCAELGIMDRTRRDRWPSAPACALVPC